MAPVPPPLLLLSIIALLPAAAPDLAADSAALLAFRAAVGRNALRTWKNASATCSWKGVTCESGRVAALRLPGSSLAGTIPAGTLGNLTALRVLSLRLNRFSGGVPADLAATALRSIFLQGNRISGGVLPVLASLGGLVRLNLAENNLSGGIPASLNKLRRLRMLSLENNHLAGEIPDLNLPALTQFNVSFNPGLNGSIPGKLRTFPSSAFLGTGLCGGPLGPCPGELPPPSSSPTQAPSPGNGGGGGGGHNKNLSGGAIAGIVVGSVAAILAVAIFLVFLCRARVAKTRSSEAAEAVAADGRDKRVPAGGSAAAPAGAAPTVAAVSEAKAEGAGRKLVFIGVNPLPFDLEDLLRASAEVLGKGTFGTTYKAVLEAGTTVAVKRPKDVKLGQREFRQKIEAVGAMVNDRLVPLRAYYYSKDEKLLVYDFMPMGSLSSSLHGNIGSRRPPLSWERRLNIALATARGIQYIHSISPSSSHGNIKSSNILLDNSYAARISDHGLASIAVPISSPTRIAAYRAPEVIDTRNVSQKADVYSFGIVLLELLTGKSPTQVLGNEEGVDLPRWIQSMVREELASEVLDMELLRHEDSMEDMKWLLQLAFDCAAQHPDSRPSMAQVVARIEEIVNSVRGRNAGEDLQREPQSADAGDDRTLGTD